MRLAYQFQGQRSRSPGPLMLTHIVRHIFRTARPTNFKLDTRMEDDDPHQPQAPRPPRSEVKVARSSDQSEPSWPCDIRGRRGGIPCRPNPAATVLVSTCMLLYTYIQFPSLLYLCRNLCDFYLVLWTRMLCPLEVKTLVTPLDRGKAICSSLEKTSQITSTMINGRRLITASISIS